MASIVEKNDHQAGLRRLNEPVEERAVHSPFTMPRVWGLTIACHAANHAGVPHKALSS